MIAIANSFQPKFILLKTFQIELLYVKIVNLINISHCFLPQNHKIIITKLLFGILGVNPNCV
jgi:hypothetical protein